MTDDTDKRAIRGPDDVEKLRDDDDDDDDDDAGTGDNVAGDDNT